MWHFIKDKKAANSGLSKQLIVVQGEPLHGLQFEARSTPQTKGQS